MHQVNASAFRAALMLFSIITFCEFFSPVSPTLYAAAIEEESERLTRFFGSDAELEGFLEKERPFRLILDQSSVTDAGLGILSQYPQITELQMSGLKITAAGLRQLTPLKNLRFLNLAGVPVGDDGMASVAQFAKLEILILDHAGVTDAGVSKLTDLKMLKDLSLLDCAISQAGLAELSRLHQLQSLSLSNCRINSDGLSRLAKLEHLRHLRLDECTIDNGALKHIKSLRRLEYASFRRSSLTDTDISDLKTLSRLQVLDLTGTDTGDASIAMAARHLKKLRDLSLGKNSTDDCFASIGKMKKLRALRIWDTENSDGGFERNQRMLKKLRLESLELRNVNISIKAIASLGNGRITRLECYSIRCEERGLELLATIPTLSSLTLINIDCDEVDFEVISKMRQLKFLMLGGGQITDRLVPSIETLTNIESLFLEGTRISKANQDKLNIAIVNRVTGLNLEPTKDSSH